MLLPVHLNGYLLKARKECSLLMSRIHLFDSFAKIMDSLDSF